MEWDQTGARQRKQRPVTAGSTPIADELYNLTRLSRNRLKEHWQSFYGTEPPHNCSQDFLRRAIAYRLQERAFGGLRPAVRRALERAAGDARERKPVRVDPVCKTAPGTVLLREWHGTRHQVTVVDDGAIYRGKRYRSLSEIARVITGSKWSGPLFFGLKSAAREVSNGAR